MVTITSRHARCCIGPVLRVVYKTHPVPDLMEFIMSEQVGIKCWLLLGKGGGSCEKVISK